MQHTIHDILKLWSGPAACARALGVSVGSVKQWGRAGRALPAVHAAKIAEEAQKLGAAWCTTDVVLAAIRHAKAAEKTSGENESEGALQNVTI